MDWTINYKDMHFEKVDEEGPFALLLNRPMYATMSCSSRDKLFDTKTQQFVEGTSVDLRATLHDENFNRLSEPIFEDDRYEVVEDKEAQKLPDEHFKELLEMNEVKEILRLKEVNANE